MKRKMQENLCNRYTGSTLDLLSKVAFLNPQFKSLTFLTASERLKSFRTTARGGSACP